MVWIILGSVLLALMNFSFPVPVTYTYLVMESGGGSPTKIKSLADLWNTVGGLNDPQGTKHSAPTINLLHQGDFRSSRIDSWTNNTPSTVILGLYNHQGDCLFNITFDSTSTTGTDMDWFLSNNIKDSSHTMNPANISVIARVPQTGWEYRIEQTASPEKVWFAIWHGYYIVYPASTQDYPIFLFSRNFINPVDLVKDHAKLYLRYCYTGNLTDIALHMSTHTLTIDDCLKCETGGGRLLFVKTNTCSCAVQYIGELVSYSTLCDGPCAGNPTQLCGKGDHYAVYNYFGSRTNEPKVPIIPFLLLQHEETVDIATVSLQIDFSRYNIVGNEAYISHIRINSNSLQTDLMVLYNMNEDCNIGRAQTLRELDSLTTPMAIPPDGTLVNIGIVAARCFHFTSYTPLSTRVMADLNISLYTPPDNFIQAPFLAIKVQVDEGMETTTSPTGNEATTTQSTSTTTSTEQQTTTTKTTFTTSELTTSKSTSQQEVTTTSTTNSFSGTVTDNAGNTNSGTQTTCPSCVCNHVINMSIVLTEKELNKLMEIKQNLTLDKNNLSSFLRTKISVPDPRPSAAGIGAFGILIMCIVFGTIVFMDISRLRELVGKS